MKIRKINSFLILGLWSFTALHGQTLPVDNGITMRKQERDWLILPIQQKADVYRSPDDREIILYNGLVRRAFVLGPAIACVDYRNLGNEQQLLRAVTPEARITINGIEYTIGGLTGQREKAYLRKEWISEMTPIDNRFEYDHYTVTDLSPYIRWKAGTWAGNNAQPTGKVLTFSYRGNAPAVKNIRVDIRYEIYDGIPLIVKSLAVDNDGPLIRIDKVVNEVLALVEEQSAVEGNEQSMRKQHGIYVETNFAYNNSMYYELSDQTTHWLRDTTYTSQVNYALRTPAILEVSPDRAPGVSLKQGESFASVRTAELLTDSYDRERRGLMIRRMYRTLAPWTTQNPVFMHLVSKNDDEVKVAIDQCADTGYEALILSFGSHCTMEDTTAANVRHWKQLADYAHSKGVKIGSYALFSSRRISDADDVIDPTTGKPGGAYFNGHAPCFGSSWGLAFRDRIKYFISKTGFDIWENDGPYVGDLCASTTHPGHEGLDDSRWRQMEIQKELYRWCNEHGVYVNAPDWYFLDGTHKIALGYREVNFSLPREQQMILNRQNIFDGTWEKTPSMSWGFVPLTRYQGGGPEAILEPLEEHLDAYRQLMMQYYGAGIQACYRGPRLYDTEKTRAVVTDVVNWYKQHRQILNSDIIHLRRADGRDWDGWLHVSATGKERALIMLFNPLTEEITRRVAIPLYYTGLSDKAKITASDGKTITRKLNRAYEAEVEVKLAPGAYWWAVVTE